MAQFQWLLFNYASSSCCYIKWMMCCLQMFLPRWLYSRKPTPFPMYWQLLDQRVDHHHYHTFPLLELYRQSARPTFCHFAVVTVVLFWHNKIGENENIKMKDKMSKNHNIHTTNYSSMTQSHLNRHFFCWHFPKWLFNECSDKFRAIQLAFSLD